MKTKMFVASVALSVLLGNGYSSSQTVITKTQTAVWDPENTLIPQLEDINNGEFLQFEKQQKETYTFSVNKNLHHESLDAQKECTIEKSVKLLTISVNGIVTEGKVTITIWKPNGKELKKIEIDPSGEVEYETQVYIKKRDKNAGLTEWWAEANKDSDIVQEFVGTWKINFKAENAYGYYWLEWETK